MCILDSTTPTFSYQSSCKCFVYQERISSIFFKHQVLKKLIQKEAVKIWPFESENHPKWSKALCPSDLFVCMGEKS